MDVKGTCWRSPRLLFLSGEVWPECRFFQCSAREALHGLVDEMDKENVRELLHDVPG